MPLSILQKIEIVRKVDSVFDKGKLAITKSDIPYKNMPNDNKICLFFLRLNNYYFILQSIDSNGSQNRNDGVQTV